MGIHYVTTNGSAAWSDSVSIESPCSLNTANATDVFNKCAIHIYKITE